MYILNDVDVIAQQLSFVMFTVLLYMIDMLILWGYLLLVHAIVLNKYIYICLCVCTRTQKIYLIHISVIITLHMTRGTCDS